MLNQFDKPFDYVATVTKRDGTGESHIKGTMYAADMESAMERVKAVHKRNFLGLVTKIEMTNRGLPKRTWTTYPNAGQPLPPVGTAAAPVAALPAPPPEAPKWELSKQKGFNIAGRWDGARPVAFSTLYV